MSKKIKHGAITFSSIRSATEHYILKSKLSPSEIAKKLDVNPANVSIAAKDMGVKLKKSERIWLNGKGPEEFLARKAERDAKRKKAAKNKAEREKAKGRKRGRRKTSKNKPVAQKQNAEATAEA